MPTDSWDDDGTRENSSTRPERQQICIYRWKDDERERERGRDRDPWTRFSHTTAGSSGIRRHPSPSSQAKHRRETSHMSSWYEIGQWRTNGQLATRERERERATRSLEYPFVKRDPSHAAGPPSSRNPRANRVDEDELWCGYRWWTSKKKKTEILLDDATTEKESERQTRDPSHF